MTGVEILMVVFGFLCCFFWFISGRASKSTKSSKETGEAKERDFFYAFCGLLSFLAFGLCLIALVPRGGPPLTLISPGVYKVGLVYHAGDNVNVWVEKPKDSEVGEGLYFYQFPQKDFEGEIKTGAKKLTATRVTTGEGTFNRYKLE